MIRKLQSSVFSMRLVRIRVIGGIIYQVALAVFVSLSEHQHQQDVEPRIFNKRISMERQSFLLYNLLDFESLLTLAPCVLSPCFKRCLYRIKGCYAIKWLHCRYLGFNAARHRQFFLLESKHKFCSVFIKHING